LGGELAALLWCVLCDVGFEQKGVRVHGYERPIKFDYCVIATGSSYSSVRVNVLACRASLACV
jgi:hypothetical protein